MIQYNDNTPKQPNTFETNNLNKSAFPLGSNNIYTKLSAQRTTQWVIQLKTQPIIQ